MGTGMNLFDVLCGLLLLRGALRGWLRGFLSVFMSIAASVAGCIAGIAIAGRVAAWLEASYGLVQRVARDLSPRITLPFGISRLPVEDMSLQAVARLVSSLEVPGPLRAAACGYLGSLGDLVTAKGIGNWGELIAYSLANMLVTVLCFLVIFAVVRWAVGRAGWGLVGQEERDSLPGPIGRIGGAVLGAAVVAVEILAAFAVLVPFLSASGGFGAWLRDAMVGSRTGALLVDLSADLFSAILSMGL